MNRIIIKGRLVRDPELRTGSNGTEYCIFTVAVDRRKQKDKDKVTDFIDCTAFNQTGVAISKYFSKGRTILVEGRMESTHTERDGQKRTYWGITVDSFEFCDSASNKTATDSASGMAIVDTDDDPFK